MPTTFPIEVTVDRLVEFHSLADALCLAELGRLPSHTIGDPVGEIIEMMALQGRTGEQIQAWLHDQPEAIAWRTKPEHQDPAAWSVERLLAIRGSLTIKLNVPLGPRPNQDDNVAFTTGLWNYTPADQQRILQAYKARSYTHAPIGPFIDPGYHGQFNPIDFRADPDRAAGYIEQIWDADICPVVFIQVDGWSIDEMRTLEPIFRSDRWQKLCRVVCNGFEQQGSVYGWSNATYVEWLSWLKSVFPNAIRHLHTISQIEAPVGAGDDTSKPGMSNGEAWGRVTPLIHGWLRQGDELFHPDHVDPSGDGRTDYAHWRDLWQTNVRGSLAARFRKGEAGWPTFSANGGPLKLYYGEGWSFDMYWENTSEEQGRTYGKEAVDLGADGAFDGWRP